MSRDDITRKYHPRVLSQVTSFRAQRVRRLRFRRPPGDRALAHRPGRAPPSGSRAPQRSRPIRARPGRKGLRRDHSSRRVFAVRRHEHQRTSPGKREAAGAWPGRGLAMLHEGEVSSLCPHFVLHLSSVPENRAAPASARLCADSACRVLMSLAETMSEHRISARRVTPSAHAAAARRRPCAGGRGSRPTASITDSLTPRRSASIVRAIARKPWPVISSLGNPMRRSAARTAPSLVGH